MQSLPTMLAGFMLHLRHTGPKVAIVYLTGLLRLKNSHIVLVFDYASLADAVNV